MAKSQTVLQRKDTTSNSALYVSFDLGDKSWQISIGDDRFHVSRYAVAAGDTAAVAAHILKAAARFKISGRSQVYSVYEAGRDGWWFHRWLCELGVGNIVVDPASIEVNRRPRPVRAWPRRQPRPKLEFGLFFADSERRSLRPAG
jgi:transposase